MAQSFGLKIRIGRIVRRVIIVRKRANDQVFLVFSLHQTHFPPRKIE